MGLGTPTTVTPRQGRDLYVIIKREEEYGVVPDDFYIDAVYLDASGETIQLARENLYSSGVRGHGHKYNRVVSGAAGISVGGDFLSDIQYKGLETLLYGALGGWAYAQPDPTNSPTVYSHAFYPVDDLPSFTIEIGKGKQVGAGFRYTGIMVNSLTLGVSADGFLTGTFGLIGKDVEAINPTTGYAITYEQLVNSTHLVTIRFIDITQIVKDISAIVGYAVSIDNQLSNDRRFLGSANIQKPQRTDKRKVNGRIVMEVGDEIVDAFTSFYYGYRHDILLNFLGTTIDGIFNKSFSIRTFRTEFRGGTPSVVSAGRQHADVPFDCFSDTIEPIPPNFTFDGEILLGMTNDQVPPAYATSIGDFDEDFAF